LPAFGEIFGNTSSNSTKKQEMPASHGQVEEYSENIDIRSATPGVIRHTSQPERLLAYYYTNRL
jgi:hypothetical protein